ncbi:hypothetical protein [Campylobacter helveticus]|uniref:hypothetical protein n=1 Tax=Campylobacter helveticus TaxID=28898 RepID=UPI0029424FB2|nr:hypothetical protein [Campylobacter helveticus]
MPNPYDTFDPFDLSEFVCEETNYLKNFLSDPFDKDDNTFDKDEIINEYRSRYEAKLQDFFDTEYGEAYDFDLDEVFGDIQRRKINKAKKEFMLEIYSYASFGDFCSFDNYKKSAGEHNNALNYLSHIPKGFHKDLYENHQYLFDMVGMRDLKYNEVDTKVEELFFKLHNEIYTKFEAKVVELNEKLPLFVPDNLDELYFLTQHFSYDTMDLSKTLAKNHIDLADKKEEMHNLLQDEVFGSIHIPYGSQEPYDDKSMIFDNPCTEPFIDKAKELLESLNYEVAVFKVVKSENRYGEFDEYIFAYANRMDYLEEAFNHILKSGKYEFDREKSTDNFLARYGILEEDYKCSQKVNTLQRVGRANRR